MICKAFFIYVIGRCNAQTREGSDIALTEESCEKRLQTFNYRDTTANRSMLHGLMDGVMQLTAPDRVVHTCWRSQRSQRQETKP